MASGGGRSTPQLNKFKLSRRGKKLQISDDQRTLLALPRDVPERTWAEILQKEENDLACFDIREEILDEALRIGYEHYMEKQNALFTAHCVAQAFLKLIDWQYYRHDPGEEPSAYPACFIPKREESWLPDELPDPSPKDCWCRQELTVIEDSPDEVLARTSSASSIDIPVIDPIPEEYWFPGKVHLKEHHRRHREEKLNASISSTDYLRKRPLVVPADVHDVWDYAPSSTTSPSNSSEENIGAESEVLQKVTDYTMEGLTSKESALSALKTTTPVEGSLHGAGDSTVGLVKAKRSVRRFDKSRSGISRSQIARSKMLPPLEADSRSHISIISDCRLRNLRLDTQYEVSSEKVDTPPTDMVKRKS